MSKNLKEDIRDKIVESVLEFIADSSKEEINELLEYKKYHKMLSKSIESFVDSLYFKQEYKNVVFVSDESCVYNLSSDELNPANTVEQISKSLDKIVKKCFVTSDESVYTNIAINIAGMYLQRAKVTVKLYDVIMAQHYEFAQLSNNISDLENKILSRFKDEKLLKLEKESLLRKELNNEVLNIFNPIIVSYITLVTKNIPQLDTDGELDILETMMKKVEDLICNIDLYITNDFLTVPVTVISLNGLEKETQVIPYFIYSEIYFRKSILEKTDKLIKYKDMMEMELFIYILRLRNELQSDFFVPLLEMGQTNILNSKKIKINVLQFQKEFKKIGEILLEIYKRAI